jgi:hypothetical protein
MCNVRNPPDKQLKLATSLVMNIASAASTPALSATYSQNKALIWLIYDLCKIKYFYFGEL